MVKRTKIPLLNFEDSINNELLLEGEKLFDEGALSGLELNSNGRWLAKVGKDYIYHIRVDVFGDFIEKTSCTCGKAENGQLCLHLICGFYGIRQADPADFSTTPPKRIPKKHRNKAVQTLLELTSKEELADFVQSYTSKDRKFNLLLKTHFARKISEKTGREIYSQILDQAFPPISETNLQSPAKNQQMLVSIVREMIVHYQDAISLEQYTDAFFMIDAVINKLSYAIQIFDQPSPAILGLQQKAHAAFTYLLNDRLAPGLRIQILDAMIETADKTYYHYTEQNNLFQQVLEYQPNPRQQKRLAEIIAFKIGLSDSFNKNVFYLNIYLYLKFELELEGTTDTWLFTLLKDPYILMETVNKLVQNQQRKLASKFLVWLQANEKIEAINFHKMRLKIHNQDKDAKIALASARSLLELTGDFQYIQQIYEFSGTKWPRQYKSLLQWLLKMDTEASSQCALNLAAKEKDLQTLIQVLRSNKRIDWFMKYDILLAGTHNDVILEFYQHYLSGFHANHAGLIGANKTALILDHLESIGLKKESGLLQSFLQKKFPERKSLQAILK